MAHYSPAQKHEKLAAFAESAANYLLERFPSLHAGVNEWHDAPLLIYRGMSGVATATAVAQHMWRVHGIELHMCYVRKEDEVSHGGACESDLDWEYWRRGGDGAIRFTPVFVDDFVSSGNTLKRTLKGAWRFFKLNLDDLYYLQANAGYSHTYTSGLKWADKDMREEWKAERGDVPTVDEDEDEVAF